MEIPDRWNPRLWLRFAMLSTRRWPRNATERAMQAVILRWHLAGCLKQLRGID